MFTKTTKKVYIYYKKLVHNIFKKYIIVNERELSGDARLTFLVREFMHKRHKIPNEILAKITLKRGVGFSRSKKTSLRIN